MENKFYGINPGDINKLNAIDSVIEEITVAGFSVIENLLTPDEVSSAASKLDSIYRQQVEEFGEENLKQINELNLARCPLAYDDFFLQLSTKPLMMEIVKHFLGSYFIINQQNGIINSPAEEHHQSSWHRDLPYQDYVISQPIAIACLICIDDFNEKTGSTYLLPFSHQLGKIPSVNYIEKNKISTNAKKGSAIVFNGMIYHKAGNNTSDHVRRGLNTLYTIPLLKQQINLFTQLKGKFSDDPSLRKLLGYDAPVPESVNEWRKNRLDRLKK